MNSTKKAFCFLLFFILFIDFHVLAQENIKTEILEEVNKLRASGCKCGDEEMPPAPGLSWNDNLEKAAARHAEDMAEHSHFDHEGTDGSDLSDRVDDAGYKWSMIGENISWGYSNPVDVVRGWKNSEGHCRNMMNAVFKEMGAAKKESYWVLDLGAGK